MARSTRRRVSADTRILAPAHRVRRLTSLSGRNRLQRASRSRMRSRAAPAAPARAPTTMTWHSEPMARKRRVSTVDLVRGMSPWSRRLLRERWERSWSTRRFGAGGQPQAVAHPPHRLDQRRLAGVDLLAEVADVGLEHAGVAGERVVPDRLEDLLPGEHAPGVGEEVVEEAVLGGRQLDQPAGPPDVAGLRVEDDVVVRQLLLAWATSGPAQHRLHPLDELLDGEGLGHVVVHAEA